MTGGATNDHWFDRLAAPQTRRQMLKAALAGATLTLPFARVGSAFAAERATAADPSCFDGCDWSNHLRYESETNACLNGLTSGLVGSATLLFFVNPFYGGVHEVGTILSHSRCNDQALLEQKARALDCLTPGCPGFDPHDKQYGPCKDCDSANGGKGFACCPTTSNLTGFTCCVCCDDGGNGCKAICS